jgi:hypothetical protein
MDDIDALDIAEAIAARLELRLGLDDVDASAVVLTRDEAVLAFGLVSALVEQLRATVPR